MTDIYDGKLQRLRIARVSTVAFFVETQLRSQIKTIVDAGASVTVIASELALDQPIGAAKYKSIYIPRKISPLRDLLALIRLWLFFSRSGFDIVHSTTPKAGLLCAIAARLAGVPIRLHTFTGQAWVGLTGFKRLVSRASDRLIVLFNSACYADSVSQVDFMVQQGIASKNQVKVLGAGSLAGIDLDRFNPGRFNEEELIELRNRFSIPHADHVLLFVGRITRDKGVAELLSAFDKLCKVRNDLFLLMVGPEESDVAPLFKELTLETRQRIATPGFSSEPERFMAIADMLVLPSYREGFGTVVIEAAAMGLPTIGTNIYGLSDAIIDGQTGLLVPVKNSYELASAIETLVSEPRRRISMGVSARGRVEGEFCSSHVNGLVIGEYLSLVQQRDHNV